MHPERDHHDHDHDGPTLNERLLLSIYEGREEPRAIAASLGLGIEAFAEWAARPKVRRTLHSLRFVSDMQTQLILSRFRSSAAAHLCRFASPPDTAELNEEKHAERIRKACVEVLKVNLPLPEQDADAAASDPPPLDPEQVLDVLARWGADDEDQSAEGEREA